MHTVLILAAYVAAVSSLLIIISKRLKKSLNHENTIDYGKKICFARRDPFLDTQMLYKK